MQQSKVARNHQVALRLLRGGSGNLEEAGGFASGALSAPLGNVGVDGQGGASELSADYSVISSGKSLHGSIHRDAQLAGQLPDSQAPEVVHDTRLPRHA